jgi:hypothetical protein
MVYEAYFKKTMETMNVGTYVVLLGVAKFPSKDTNSYQQCMRVSVSYSLTKKMFCHTFKFFANSIVRNDISVLLLLVSLILSEFEHFSYIEGRLNICVHVWEIRSCNFACSIPFIFLKNYFIGI